MDSSIEGLPATALVLITTVLSCTQWVHAAFSTGNYNNLVIVQQFISYNLI